MRASLIQGSRSIYGWLLVGALAVPLVAGTVARLSRPSGPMAPPVDTLTVTITAAPALPLGMCAKDPAVVTTLTAVCTNPPTADPECTLAAPTWTWDAVVVQYKATSGAAYGASPGGDTVTLTDLVPADPAKRKLSCKFDTAGYWRVIVTAHVKYTETGSGCDGEWTGTGVYTAEFLVMMVEILNTNDADKSLNSPPAVTTEVVAIRVNLKAKLTPADMPAANLTYLWAVTGGGPIATYDLYIDDKAFPKTDPLSVLNLDKLAFFWTDVSAPGNHNVKLTVTNTAKTIACMKSVDFSVAQDPDPNQNIYCYEADLKPTWGPIGTAAERLRRCPRKPTLAAPQVFYKVLRSHRNWHDGGQMDESPTVNPPPLGVANWGDTGPGGVDFDFDYVGSAFFIWHKAFIDTHAKWRTTFNIAAVVPLPNPSAPPITNIPDWLNPTPPNTSTVFSPQFKGYVRLGEFEDLDKVGAEQISVWHNAGHAALDATSPGMNFPRFSPGSANDLFWRWHTRIDQVRNDYGAGPTFASVISRDPVQGNTVGAVPAIYLTFDKRVSFNFATVLATHKENTRQIKVAYLKVNSGPAGATETVATNLEDVGVIAPPAISRYMQFKFTIKPPVPGLVTVTLTGNIPAAPRSFNGDTYTFTFAPLAPTITACAPATGVNTADQAVTLTGTNFAAGITVTLKKATQPDIVVPAANISVDSATSIVCTLPITGKAAGAWDIVVKNTNTPAAPPLAGGFTITVP